MTLSVPDDDDVKPSTNDGGDRPDWLVDTDEGLGQAPARPVPPRATPGLPSFRGPSAAAVPAAERAPGHRTLDVPEKAEGLIRPDMPNVPLPADSHEWEGQRGYSPASFQAQAATPRPTEAAAAGTTPAVDRARATPPAPPEDSPTAPAPRDEIRARVAAGAWSAAASSIPSLRGTRRRTIPVDDPTPDDVWDEERFTAPRAGSVDPIPPIPTARRPLDPFAAVLKFAARVPPPVIAVAAGVLIAVVIAAVMMRPKEEFTSIRHIKTHAREMDGQLVNIRGTVGQSFPVGGGFAFYLHQSRDTIVVFTRNRTPVERKHIKLMGTVSTGYLDGAPRAAIFEDPPPPPS